MQCSRSYCQAEFRSALLPSICQLAADDNAFPWFVPSLTLFRWLYTTRTVSVRLFLSRPSSLPPPLPLPHPSPPPTYLFICTATLSPRRRSFPFSIAFTLLFPRMAMCALCSGVMVSLLNYHQLQISFYFGKVLIHTRARASERTSEYADTSERARACTPRRNGICQAVCRT